jgi:metallo-beta-lactamase class B
VKYLLNSHAHFDHAGGLAALKRASHAQLIASAGDAATLNSGHQLSYGPGQDDTHFPAVAVDRVVGDGDTVSLGGVTLTAHLTQGHTKGCTSWSTTATSAGKTYQVVFACSLTVAGNQLVGNPKYPNVVADYRHSFTVLRHMPCDVLLTAHPEFFRMQEKVAKAHSSGPNPFIDPGELKEMVDSAESDFDQELARQKKHR